MLEPKSKTLDKIQFTNHSREEVILWLRKNVKKNPSFERLAKWIAESSEFDKAHYAVQVALADARRAADKKGSIEAVKEGGDLMPWSTLRKS